MENLPLPLVEIILSFVHTKDVKNFGLTCKTYLAATKECTKIGWMYDTKVRSCEYCLKFDLYPMILKLKVANRQEKKKAFVLCSKKCKHWLFCGLPRCNFCLSTVTYEDRIDRTLFCSEQCIEYSDQRVPRERYIV
jgi:endogenous inhibitor of DNA gyrase (YacG/DUF329 family)